MSTAVIVGCVVQVTLFALAAAVVHLVAKRVHASLGSVTASLSLLLVLVLTALAWSPWPRWELAPSSPSADIASTPTVAADTANEEPTARLEASAVEVADASPTAAAAWQAFVAALADPQPSATTATPTAASHFTWRSVLRWMLGLGLVVGLARFVWGVWTVRKLARASRPVDEPSTGVGTFLDDLCRRAGLLNSIRLRESSDIATPATVGWRRPTILLPNSWRQWSREELTAVLAHELAHIASRDYRSWLVARLAVAVHFYHPLVHWLARRLQLEQELAADAMAAGLVGDRDGYLRSLASLALATPIHRLAGPAHTLIPGRSLLMRRVEMLREAKRRTSSGSSRGISRTVAALSLALLALATAGVRQAAIGQEGTREWAKSPAPLATAESVPRIGLGVVPEDTVCTVSIRPAEILRKQEFEKVAELLDRLVPDEFEGSGLSVSDLAELMVIFHGSPVAPPRLAIRFTTPDTCNAVVQAIDEDMKKSPGYDPSARTPEWRTDRERLAKIDPLTIVFDKVRDRAGSSLPPTVRHDRGWSDEWQSAADKQLVVAFDLDRFRAQAGPEGQQELFGGFPMQMVGPALTATHWCVASVDMMGGLSIEAIAQCDDEKKANDVASTFQAVLTLLGNMVEQQRAAAMTGGPQAIVTPKQRASMDALFDLATELCREGEIVTEVQEVKFSFHSKMANAQLVAASAAVLLPAAEVSLEASRRTQSMNNLKQLQLAMLNYEATYGHFPPAVIYEVLADGTRVGRSWRVELLPFLEHQALYDQYKKQEHWDRAANREVLAKMPAVFRAPSDSPSSTNTSYFALTGNETIFDGEQGTTFGEITDGTSMTIALVDAKRDIPWTKPEDIPYDPGKPVPELGGWHPTIFLAAFCDGSVQVISQDVDEAVLRGLISKAGGEVLNRP